MTDDIRICYSRESAHFGTVFISVEQGDIRRTLGIYYPKDKMAQWRADSTPPMREITYETMPIKFETKEEAGEYMVMRWLMTNL